MDLGRSGVCYEHNMLSFHAGAYSDVFCPVIKKKFLYALF